MTCCTLGARPDIETITKAMLPVDQGGEGLTVRAVAERFQITRYQVERHWKCLRSEGVANSRGLMPAEPESERRLKAPQTEAQTTGQTHQTARQTAADTAQTETQSDGVGDATIDPNVGGWRDRIWHIANLIASDQYRGRETNLELSEKYGVGRDQIINDVRVAGLMVSKDRNSIEVQREVSLAKLTTIRQQAMEKTKMATCPSCEAGINVAAPDYKAAISAQKHMDEIAGVHVKQPPTIQIKVDPIFGQVWGYLSRLLEQKHPEALADCERALMKLEASLRRRDVIDVDAEVPMLEAG